MNKKNFIFQFLVLLSPKVWAVIGNSVGSLLTPACCLQCFLLMIRHGVVRSAIQVKRGKEKCIIEEND